MDAVVAVTVMRALLFVLHVCMLRNPPPMLCHCNLSDSRSAHCVLS